MADNLTPQQRHSNMAAIHGKDTKPELLVRKFLHAHGYRFRLHEKRLPGRPDIVMKRLHTVIMVNGCFWHGHLLEIPGDGNADRRLNEDDAIENSACCKIPHTNRNFWVNKIVRNHERDLRDRAELHQLGWNVITIWECELKPAVRMQTLQSLLFTLSQIELSLHKPKPQAIPYNFDEEPTSMVADDSIDEF